MPQSQTIKFQDLRFLTTVSTVINIISTGMKLFVIILLNDTRDAMEWKLVSTHKVARSSPEPDSEKTAVQWNNESSPYVWS